MDAGAALCAPSGPGDAYTPGWDLAATIEAVGREVKDLAPGQRVFGPARFPHAGSTYAEHAMSPQKTLFLPLSCSPTRQPPHFPWLP